MAMHVAEYAQDPSLQIHGICPSINSTGQVTAESSDVRLAAGGPRPVDQSG